MEKSARVRNMENKLKNFIFRSFYKLKTFTFVKFNYFSVDLNQWGVESSLKLF